MFCPSCSRSVPEGSTFCPWCGKSLSLGSCPHCGVKAPDGAQFCLSCGKPLMKEGNPSAPLANVGNVTFTLNAVPPQGGTQAAAHAQDTYRPLTTNEVEALKQAAAWEVKIGQVFGFVTIFWGVIGFFAPVDPLKFGLVGLIPGIVGLMAGLAAKQKLMTANQAIASGRAVEFTGVAKAEGKNMRRIDVDGGNIRFTTQRIPKALDDATRGDGTQVKVTFTEGGTEVPAATETMVLAVNGVALPKPVLGQVVVTK